MICILKVIDSLSLANVFGNFRNTCHEIYEFVPGKLVSDPRLAWNTALKETKVILDLLTDIKKGIRGGICHSIYQ